MLPNTAASGGGVTRSDLGGVDWSRVVVAATFCARLRGLMPRPRDRGLLLRTWTVHGFGMREALRVYGIDDHGEVTTSHLLRPQRVIVSPGSTWMLEVPINWPEIPIGSLIPFPR